MWITEDGDYKIEVIGCKPLQQLQISKWAQDRWIHLETTREVKKISSYVDITYLLEIPSDDNTEWERPGGTASRNPMFVP